MATVRFSWQHLAVMGVFSTLTSYYGYSFGREAARRDLEAKIKELKEQVKALQK
jgi:hypothetical protein